MPPPRRMSGETGQRLLGRGVRRTSSSAGWCRRSSAARGDGFGGAASSTCCEPSRLVWPILAVAFLGSLTLFVQAQRQRGDPVLQLDRPHRADEDVGHPHPAVAVDRQGVRHLHVDGRRRPSRCPGRPGSARCEMPCQPHELSTMAATSSTSPCQLRWRITRRAPSLADGSACSRAALVAPHWPPPSAGDAGPPASVPARPPAPASGRPGPGSRRVPAAAAGSALAGLADDGRTGFSS